MDFNNGLILQWGKSSYFTASSKGQQTLVLPITMNDRGIWVVSRDCNNPNNSYACSGYVDTETFSRIIVSNNGGLEGYINFIVLGY